MVALPANIGSKESLQEAYMDCRRLNGTNRGMVAVFLDGNGIKRINDTYGHLVGDEVISRLAEIISSNVRSAIGDKVIRFGGDEFVLILNGFTDDVEHIRTFLTRILTSIRQDKTLIAKVGGVTMSAGAVRFSKRFDSLDKAIAEADRLMYIAKKSFPDYLIISGDLAAENVKSSFDEKRNTSPHALRLRSLYEYVFLTLSKDADTSNSAVLKDSMRDVWKSQRYKLTDSMTINSIIKLVKKVYAQKTKLLF